MAYIRRGREESQLCSNVVPNLGPTWNEISGRLFDTFKRATVVMVVSEAHGGKRIVQSTPTFKYDGAWKYKIFNPVVCFNAVRGVINTSPERSDAELY
jgi:hypothetical protein